MSLHHEVRTKYASRLAVAVWLAVLVACAVWLHRNLSVGTDLTVFLPPSTNPAQRILVSQLRDGVATRLILIALEGEEPATLAAASRELARRLMASGLFGSVNNGDLAAANKERELLVKYRYLLSPAISPERFTSAGLVAALNESLALLASPAGPFIRNTLAQDPTGESRQVLEFLVSETGPEMVSGVWFSRDGKRALLAAETVAAGFDIDGQTRAIEVIRDASRAVGAKNLKLLLSGPGVFAAEARATIQSEARWLSAVATVLVILILLAVYRALGPIVLSALPVATGLLVAIAAVGWLFGPVHGITLGFGATLIGETVDYPSYAFIQAARGERLSDTFGRMGPTLKLAVLTTVFGASAMALSSFQGLAQLGVLTIVGVGAAGLATRWVLPAIAPARWIARKAHALPFDGNRLVNLARHGSRFVGVLVVAALAVIVWRYDRVWDDDLANLSPVSEAAKTLDRSLRTELGAPDVRYVVIARGKDRESALEASESAAVWLQQSLERGSVAGYDVPSRYLPSTRTQERRRAALPDAETLKRNLDLATRDLPFREGLFTPFLESVERTRTGSLLTAEELWGTAFALKVNALLVRSDGGWAALVPLRGVSDPASLAGAASRAGDELLDLKSESNDLVNSYRNQSLRLIALGLVCIFVLLAWGLRTAGAARVLTPVLAAVIVDVAILLLWGNRLTLFNLVALLLVVGIGLNYALFFNRPAPDPGERQRTLLSLVVCVATTLSAFCCLAFSQTPVLRAIGITVTLGTMLSFVIAAALSKDPDATARMT
jgi:predicted exporter